MFTTTYHFPTFRRGSRGEASSGLPDDDLQTLFTTPNKGFLEVNHANSFEFFAMDTVTSSEDTDILSQPTPNTANYNNSNSNNDFDSFDFFDGIEFDDDDDDNNSDGGGGIEAPSCKKPRSMDGAQQMTPPPPVFIADVSSSDFFDLDDQDKEHLLLLDLPKLGDYTQEERDKLLEAYREKRKKRQYGKVRYVLRQKVSENRPRVKGRFVTKSPTAPSPSTSIPQSMPPPAAVEETFVAPIEPTSIPPPQQRTRKQSTTWELLKNLSLFPAKRSVSNSSSSSAELFQPQTKRAYNSFSEGTNSKSNESTWSDKLIELRAKKRNNSTEARQASSNPSL